MRSAQRLNPRLEGEVTQAFGFAACHHAVEQLALAEVARLQQQFLMPEFPFGGHAESLQLFAQLLQPKLRLQNSCCRAGGGHLQSVPLLEVQQLVATKAALKRQKSASAFVDRAGKEAIAASSAVAAAATATKDDDRGALRRKRKSGVGYPAAEK